MGGLAVVVLGVAGFVLLRLLNPAGGAGSPEEAVTELVDGLTRQDPVAALRLLNPGEVEGLDDVLTTVRGRLKEAGVSSDDRLLDAATVSVSGLEVEADPLGEHASRVYVDRGTLTVDIDPDKLPERLAQLRPALAKEHTWDLDLSTLLEQAGMDEAPFLTTVEVDGRWYVTLLGTAGEYVAEATDNQGGDYDYLDGDEPEPKVASSPEGALDQVMDAARDNDVEALVAAMPQDEVGVLQAYTDLAQDLIADYGVSYSLDPGPIRTSAGEEADDLRKLTLKDVEVSATGMAGEDYGEGSLSLRGDCLEVDGGRTCMSRRFTDLTGLDSYFLMVRHVDDGWQVDPLATVVAYADTVISSVPEDVALAATGLYGMIDPTATAKSGASTEVDFGDSGLGVLDVPADRGQVVVVSVDGPDSVYTQTYSPGDVEADYYGGDSAVAVADRKGSYRVVIGDYEKPFERGSVDVDVDVVSPRQGKPEDVLSEGEAVAFSARGAYEVPEGILLFQSDGDEQWEGDLDGDYVAVATRDRVHLTKSVVAFTDGSTSYSGSLFDSTVVSFTATRGRTVTLTADAPWDLLMAVDEEDVVADSEVGGSTEYLSFTPSRTGEFTLRVEDVGGTGGGDFDLTIGDY